MAQLQLSGACRHPVVRALTPPQPAAKFFLVCIEDFRYQVGPSAPVYESGLITAQSNSDPRAVVTFPERECSHSLVRVRVNGQADPT